MPRDRVCPDRRGAGTAPVVQAARAHGPPGREADRGSRQRRRTAGTPWCRRRPWLVPGSGPGCGHKLPDGQVTGTPRQGGHGGSARRDV